MVLRRVLASALGALAARATLAGAVTSTRLERTNFRGRPVTLAGGPALAVGASVGAAAGAGDARVATAAAIAGLGSGAVGFYDDIVGGRPEHAAKGFQGHLRALREGRVTSGLVKIAGVGASALVAAAVLPPRRARRRTLDVLLGAGVIAGSANLANLLDLRPGRAIKAGLIVGAPLAARSGVASGALGAAGALLPNDLGEEIMLGDAGANAFGALLGTAFVARAGTAGRLAALAGLVALTAASEKVSFTQVIQRTPGLRELDELGRLKQEQLDDLDRVKQERLDDLDRPTLGPKQEQ
jgi:UDP-N-acetylmuramyl pentapeptide phosphotransferase/UDP-N-acetylglucosamine-1-phosphate transferase